ncbi:MAG: NADH-quinone oxidoreductase subunit C [Nitrospirae bacterium]|nr:NADH-quinone oxidoreductase subunit C [Nitrospirota bacterium]
MEPAEIAAKIKELYPADVVDVRDFRGQCALVVKKDDILEILMRLHDDPEFNFDFLKDLCGVDYLSKRTPRFEVIYQLYSIQHKHMIRIAVQVPEKSLSLESCTCIWNTANWHERECYDMYGIVFENHPDLRRVLMPEDWEGYPLRKDYPVEGPEEEWRGFKEVLQKHEEYKKYEWNR